MPAFVTPTQRVNHKTMVPERLKVTCRKITAESQCCSYESRSSVGGQSFVLLAVFEGVQNRVLISSPVVVRNLSASVLL